MLCQSIRASRSDEPLAGYVGRMHMKIDVLKHFEVFYPQTTSWISTIKGKETLAACEEISEARSYFLREFS